MEKTVTDFSSHLEIPISKRYCEKFVQSHPNFLSLKLFLLFFSLSLCLSNSSFAQSRTLKIDRPFKIASIKDSVAAYNCTLQTARILDSLKNIFNYSFIEDNSNNSQKEFKLQGIIFETDSVDGKIYFLRKSYFVKVDLLDEVKNELISTRTMGLNNYSTFSNESGLKSSLLTIILDILKDMP